MSFIYTLDMSLLGVMLIGPFVAAWAYYYNGLPVKESAILGLIAAVVLMFLDLFGIEGFEPQREDYYRRDGWYDVPTPAVQLTASGQYVGESLPSGFQQFAEYDDLIATAFVGSAPPAPAPIPDLLSRFAQDRENSAYIANAPIPASPDYLTQNAAWIPRACESQVEQPATLSTFGAFGSGLQSGGANTTSPTYDTLTDTALATKAKPKKAPAPARPARLYSGELVRLIPKLRGLGPLSLQVGQQNVLARPLATSDRGNQLFKLRFTLVSGHNDAKLIPIRYNAPVYLEYTTRTGETVRLNHETVLNNIGGTQVAPSGLLSAAGVQSKGGANSGPKFRFALVNPNNPKDTGLVDPTQPAYIACANLGFLSVKPDNGQVIRSALQTAFTLAPIKGCGPLWRFRS
jgi:hypothetical protein